MQTNLKEVLNHINSDNRGLHAHPKKAKGIYVVNTCLDVSTWKVLTNVDSLNRCSQPFVGSVVGNAVK